MIDIVVEVVDARIPRSGRNPLLDELAARRARRRGARSRRPGRSGNHAPLDRRSFAARLLAGCGRRAQAAQRRPGRGPHRASARARRRRREGVARDDRRATELGEIHDRQRAAPPFRGEDRGSRRRDASAAVVSPRAHRGADGYPRRADSQNSRRRGAMEACAMRCGSARAATTRRRSSAPSTTGFSAAGPARPCRICTALPPRAASFGAAPRSTITMPPSPTSARSTTAFLDGFPWRLPMTAKQRKAKNAYERERRRLHRLHHFEYAARERGFTLVAGVDEVGRGPLAGPVVAACVVASEPLDDQGTQRFQAGAAGRCASRSPKSSRFERPRGPSAARALPRSTV